MNLPPLSNRLKACCSFVNPGDRVADVGCDHGYLGISLLLEEIASSVIASDVNRFPLDSAQHNARKYRVANRISFFLSDGVQNIPRDFDTMVCAGMGADTMISILDAAPWLKDHRYRLVLQCQSRRPELRKYLYEQGYCIEEETLAEDGRFIYPVMLVTYKPSRPLTPGGYHISPALLRCESPLLPTFYKRVLTGLETTVAGLERTGGEKYEQYLSVLREVQKMEGSVYGKRG